MKRINTVFTTINILAVLGMLIHMGILYNNAHTISAPRAIVFTGALVYILPLMLLNLIWALIQKIVIQKGKTDMLSADVPARTADRSRHIKIVFIALNAMVFVIMAIHNGFDIRAGGNSYFQNLIGWIWILYIIPLIVINNAWVVVSMNMKDRLEVGGK